MPKKVSFLLIVLALLIGSSGLLVGCGSDDNSSDADETSEEQISYAGKKVMWVDSYHKGYEWSDGIESGLQAILGDTDVEFKIARMDTKRNTDEEFRLNAVQQIREEIDAFQPDVLIASDDNAQSYLIVPYYKDTTLPIVFCGVNWDASIYGYPTSNVTGMIEVELPGQMVDRLKQYASGDRLAYLTVGSETETKSSNAYNERFFDGEMRVVSVRTLDEFKEAFLTLQEEVDMVFLGNNAGIDAWDQEEMEQFFLETSTIPTGSINSWMAPYALMTLAKRAEEQGEWAAQTALSILDGTPVSEIPVDENQDGLWILNLDIAETLGIAFPVDMLRNADTIGGEGNLGG